eukprot:TRINITY_DN6968_c1_g2_i1.p1 TRINITY_DN6968_c1_g2~~TRINITY_DN6968_c1_g2_i1.p1  ORF type:complete len:391 (-),score=77.93 TRINITY_DN6968_c1_g2_i1:257-1429(-)
MIFVVLVSLFLLSRLSEAADCDNSNEFAIVYDGNRRFVVGFNGSCTCSSFVGGGQQLTGLEQNPTIASLRADINSKSVAAYCPADFYLRGIYDNGTAICEEVKFSNGRLGSPCLVNANCKSPLQCSAPHRQCLVVLGNACTRPAECFAGHLCVAGVCAATLLPMTNMVANFAGADLTADGSSRVSQWLDRSIHSRDLMASPPPPALPTLLPSAINGLPALAMAGSALTSSVAFTMMQPLTIYMVARLTTAGPLSEWGYLLDGRTNNDRIYIAMQNGVTNGLITGIISGGVGLGTITLASDFWQQTYHYYAFVYNGAYSVVRRGGTQMQTGSIPLGGSTSGITLGGRFNGQEYGPFHIAELLIYNANHFGPASNTVDGLAVENYLKTKYGL